MLLPRHAYKKFQSEMQLQPHLFAALCVNQASAISFIKTTHKACFWNYALWSVVPEADSKGRDK